MRERAAKFILMRIGLQCVPYRMTDIEDTTKPTLRRISLHNGCLVGNTLFDKRLPFVIHKANRIADTADLSPGFSSHKSGMLDDLTIA